MQFLVKPASPTVAYGSGMEQLWGSLRPVREGTIPGRGEGAGPSVRLRERMNAIRSDHGAAHARVR